MPKNKGTAAVIQREVQRIVAQRTIERVQMCQDAAMIAARSKPATKVGKSFLASTAASEPKLS